MFETFAEAFDLYLNMFCVVILLWIAICIVLYVFGNPIRAAEIMIIRQSSVQEAGFPVRVPATPFIREPTPCGLSEFRPPLCSTPVPHTIQETIPDVPIPLPSTSTNNRTCNPGRMTNNPWLNFLRYFRTLCCGIRQTELFQRAAQAWRNMTEVEKEPYRQQAEQMKSMRSPGHGRNHQ